MNEGVRRCVRRTLLSIGLVLVVPVVLDLVMYAFYLAQYEGICGPHPTDIPAYRCSLDTYAAEFWGGWNAIGMAVVDVLAVVVAIAVVLAFWVLYALVYVVRASRPLPLVHRSAEQ